MFWWDRAWYFLLLHCAQRKSRRDMYLALLWFACAQLMAQGAWRRKFVSEMSPQLRLHLPGLSLPISPSSIDGCQRCAEPAFPSPANRAKVSTPHIITADRPPSPAAADGWQRSVCKYDTLFDCTNTQSWESLRPLHAHIMLPVHCFI